MGSGCACTASNCPISLRTIKQQVNACVYIQAGNDACQHSECDRHRLEKQTFSHADYNKAEQYLRGHQGDATQKSNAPQQLDEALEGRDVDVDQEQRRAKAGRPDHGYAVLQGLKAPGAARQLAVRQREDCVQEQSLRSTCTNLSACGVKQASNTIAKAHRHRGGSKKPITYSFARFT